jgi:hypothetical protein
MIVISEPSSQKNLKPHQGYEKYKMASSLLDD